MYLINKEDNNIESIKQITFKSAGFKERQHLQEWIAKNPESLGEELLIIQKEFSGFGDTNERLDLLALDKKGNLVIIENKLDDTGKDVVWQSLKYSSYCSSLNNQEIRRIFKEYLDKNRIGRNADEVLSEFFEDENFDEMLNIGQSQRIILVAGEFRKEVTSTVLWLLDYGLKIQCFKVTPFKVKDDLLLDFDQIIPIKEVEEYMIKIATKKREEVESKDELRNSYRMRLKFWAELLNKKNSLCTNISPSKDAWISVGIGMGGVTINLVVAKSYARTEIYINRGTHSKNKETFDFFYSHKENIEKKFASKLIWERMDDNVTSRIKWQLDGVSLYNEKDWEKMINFMLDGLDRMNLAFRDVVNKLKSGN